MSRRCQMGNETRKVRNFREFEPGSAAALARARGQDCPPVSHCHALSEVIVNRLDLEQAQLQLLEIIFFDCSHAVISPLAGGLSGSLVLTVDSYDAESRRNQPTVLKLDKEKEMREEVEQTRYVNQLIGFGPPWMVRCCLTGTHPLNPWHLNGRVSTGD